MIPRIEIRLLQIAICTACIVPLTAGAVGMGLGPWMLKDGIPPDLNSHFRYLSGLLFAIGIGFLSTVPRIAERGPRFRLLTSIVAVGGLARLGAAVFMATLTPAIVFPLVMELLVTPGLALWQRRVAKAVGR